MRTKRLPGNLVLLSAVLVTSTARAQAPHAPPAAEAAQPPRSWFYRPAQEFKFGPENFKWSLQIYGFADLSAINDSTRGFNESLGQGLIPRSEVLAANGNAILQANGQPVPNPAAMNGRTQFTSRNSRIGLKLNGPVIEGVKPSGVLEMDFFGNQPPYSGQNFTSNATGAPIREDQFYNLATFRLRHAYARIESSIVDVMAGQSYYLFGNQGYFFPSTTEFLALPNEVFGRTTQIRVTKVIRTDPVTVEVAVAATRPPQRDSSIPGGEGALLFKLNDWKGIHTPGALGTTADPLAIGVSGAVRHFKVDFPAPGYGYPVNVPVTTKEDTGWGISIDALIPVIPAQNSDDRSNKVTVTGSFTTGTGYSDQFGGTPMGGLGPVVYPYAPGYVLVAPPPNTTPAPVNYADIDPGLVLFDPFGNLHTVNWQTFMAGIQYYLPGGRIFVSGNFTHGSSNNIASLVGGAATVDANGAVSANPKAKAVIKESSYLDGSIFFDVTPAIRVGLTASLLTQVRAEQVPTPGTSGPPAPLGFPQPYGGPLPDNSETPRNIRYRLCFYYAF